MGHRKFKFAAVLLLTIALVGCAARAIHPGSVNKFDSEAYDVLLVTDNVIQSTKTDLANNVFSAGVAAKVKDSVNYLIQAYNTADIAYKAYHAAAVSGGATPAQQAAVTSSLNNVSSATSALVNAKAGK